MIETKLEDVMDGGVISVVDIERVDKLPSMGVRKHEVSACMRVRVV